MHILQTLSTPKLVIPNVYSYSELTVGKECRKWLLFTVITIAAKVTNRSLRSRK